MKRFGSSREPVEQEDIELVVERDGREEILVFTILPRIGAGDALGVMSLARKGDAAAMARVDGLLSRVMVNNGNRPGSTVPLTPAQWTAQALPGVYRGADGRVQPLPAERILEKLSDHERDYIERNRLPEHDRGPDGVLYPMSDTATREDWENPANGTSRRRWRYLIDEDDSAFVQLSDLYDIVQYIVGKAADRPTQSQT